MGLALKVLPGFAAAVNELMRQRKVCATRRASGRLVMFGSGVKGRV